ncbi:hypothetical protein CfE428DRAFT_1878 [Chthoniobacter flavus Ellin428]|uniref:Uncharacterized protein n=1 Tax=Chthoniobacter flavus Ellin428 TaxID=497964 RepID=B4CYZ0_9BACT|nr:hypothetical protein [Chthoniobacter flavus]EDY20681.1 hypothetical protein CfE428DRAFT_1878 [Chthoniobacter flavus Ellin428]TCO89580.1 hypothetical protein EV701_11316 [Chthoniobacter flavus]
MISQKLIDFAHHREADWIDILSRELHVLIAAKLREDSALLGIPLYNLRIWKRTATPEMKIMLRRWKLILMAWNPEEIADFLVSDTIESRELRRCSPFCGVLTPQEIASVWQASTGGQQKSA